MSHPEHFHSSHVFWVEFWGEFIGRRLRWMLLSPGRTQGTKGENEAWVGQCRSH